MTSLCTWCHSYNPGPLKSLDDAERSEGEKWEGEKVLLYLLGMSCQLMLYVGNDVNTP